MCKNWKVIFSTQFLLWITFFHQYWSSPIQYFLVRHKDEGCVSFKRRLSELLFGIFFIFSRNCCSLISGSPFAYVSPFYQFLTVKSEVILPKLTLASLEQQNTLEMTLSYAQVFITVVCILLDSLLIVQSILCIVDLTSFLHKHLFIWHTSYTIYNFI